MIFSLLLAAAVNVSPTNPRYFETADGKLPETLANECVPFRSCTLDCYLPWEDRRVSVRAPQLPPFKRSIVVRVPTSAVEGVVRPN